MKLNTKAAVFITVFFLLMGYASVPMAFGADDKLDEAIRELSNYLNGRIPKGNKVLFLNVKSDYSDFSTYILNSLQENGVNDDIFTVVDRQQLDAIRSELKFQWSGEVSDASAQEIGKLLGAQIIVSGSVTEVGSEYRIQVRAIEVQTAALLGASSQNVSVRGPLVKELTTTSVANAAREEKRQEDALKRQASTERFLRNSGISIGGWGGYMGHERDMSKFSGGGDIELRLFRFFGLQSGFAIFQDVDNPDDKNKPLTESLITQTILQIPVLARATVNFDIYYFSIYGGVGINQFLSNNPVITMQSTSPLSFIAGGDIGIYLAGLHAFGGYQFNRDTSETEYKFRDKDFSCFGQRSIITFGVRFLIPFRR